MIQGTYERESKLEQIYCGIKKGQKKIFRRNKKDYEKLSDHIGFLPLVAISPSDSTLINDGSELRRKFIDGIISQYDSSYLEALLSYNKALSQRNALLKYFFKQRTFNQDQLDGWDLQLVKYGEIIFSKRNELIANLLPIFQKYYLQISGGNENVQLVYQSQLEDGDFEGQIKRATGMDRRKLYSTVGIHKDDLLFQISDRPIKKFGSQGQQKSYIIALRLAQYEWLKAQLNVTPVLLLDDIFDKLDQTRVERLMKLVHDQFFGQVLVTDTDEDRIREIFAKNDLESKMFQVNEGVIGEL